MTTWRHELERLLAIYGETFHDIEYIYPDEGVLDIEFDDRYGTAQGPSVLVFTRKRVYFPREYDGAEDLASVPRAPEFIQGRDGGHI